MTTPPPQVIPVGKIVVQADAIVPSIGGIATTIPAISAGSLLTENMKTNTIMTNTLGVTPVVPNPNLPIGQITTGPGSGDIQVENANLRVDNTTQSTGAFDGSLSTKGGMDVGLDLYNHGKVHVMDSTASTGNNDGSFTNAGGADFQDMTYFHGGATGSTVITNALEISTTTTAPVLTMAGIVAGPGSSDIQVENANLRVDSTTQSTGTYNGSLSTQGGMDVGLDLYNHGKAHVLDSTQSTGTYNGSLSTAGGMDVGLDLYNHGKVHVLDTTASTANNDGSFTVMGGADFGNMAYFHTGAAAGEIITNILELTTATTVPSTQVPVIFGGPPNDLIQLSNANLQINNNTQSTGTFNGSLSTKGGMDVGLDLYNHGKVHVLDASASTGNNDGSFTNAGGADFQDMTYFHGGATGSTVITNALEISTATTAPVLTMAGIVAGPGSSDIQVENANLRVDSTTQSTGTYNGSLSTAGGMDVGLDLYNHGKVHVVDTTDSTGNNDGSFTTLGGMDVGLDLYNHGRVHVVDTTQSTGAYDGSLSTLGGMDVGLDLYNHGKAHVTNSTPSTGNNDGSFTNAGGADFQMMSYFHGGASFQNVAYFGGGAEFQNQTTFNGIAVDQNGNPIVGTNVISNYTTTFYGPWTAPSAIQILPAAIQGTRVMLTIPQVQAIFNIVSGAFSTTALPSALMPITQQYCPFYIMNNGAGEMGVITIFPNGNIQISLLNGGGFSAGTCGWFTQTVTYYLS